MVRFLGLLRTLTNIWVLCILCLLCLRPVALAVHGDISNLFDVNLDKFANFGEETLFPTLQPTFSATSRLTEASSYYPTETATAAISWSCSKALSANMVQIEGTVTAGGKNLSIAWYYGQQSASSTSNNGVFSSWKAYLMSLQNMQLYASPTAFYYLRGNNCTSAFVTGSSVASSFTVRESVCTDSAAVTLIWSAIINGIAFQMQCGNSLWQGSVDADKSSGYLVYVNGSIVLSGEGSGNKGRDKQFMLGVSTKNFTSLWPEWSQSSIAGATNVTVTYALQHLGNIHCAAFPSSSAQQLSTPLSVLQAPSHVWVSVTDYSQLEGALLVERLLPLTGYTIYCYTEALWGSAGTLVRSPLSATLSGANTVQTGYLSIITVSVSIPFTSLSRTTVSPAITVSPANQANLTIVVSAAFLGSTYCSSTMVNVGISNSSEVDSDSIIIAPSALTFSGTVTKDIFFVQTLRKGCYGLFMQYYTQDLSAPLTSVVEVQYVTPLGQVSGDVFFFNSTVDASTDVYMQSVSFSVDGLRLEIRFSASTDSGSAMGLDPIFDCGLVVRFPGSELSTCWFESSTLLVASFPSPLSTFPSATSMLIDIGLPNVGDVVELVENTIRPNCVLPSGAACAKPVEDYVVSGTVSISAAMGPTVSAVISAPQQIAVGNSLTLDLSSSTGNGGRNWYWVNWTVSMAVGSSGSYQPALSLQNFLNNGSLQWLDCVYGTSGCDTLPGSFFSDAGTYHFSLLLSNFAGWTSSTSIAVQVMKSGFIPAIYIYGASLASLPNNATTIFRAISVYSSEYCPSIAVSWLIYENGVIQNSLASGKHIYKDSRTLAIGGYVLTPGNEYRVGVTMLCGRYSAYAEVTRYISACMVIPVLQNGSSLSISLSNRLVLDASQSYLSCSKQSDLVYQWSCVQRYPLNNTGCALFYQAVQQQQSESAQRNQSTSVLVFPTTGSIFTGGVSYLITVRVTSPTWSVTAQSSQTLTTLVDLSSDAASSSSSSLSTSSYLTPVSSSLLSSSSSSSSASVPVLSVLSSNSSIITLDGSSSFSIDAFIQSNASSVLAQWVLTSTNETLSTRRLWGAGMHYFPAVFSALHIQDGSLFSFTLQAVSLDRDSSCIDFSCASIASLSTSLIAVSQIRVNVNQPPSAGSLIAYPSMGDESTMFLISATNWQDQNLPLYYIFYQSSSEEDTTGEKFHLLRQRMQIPYMSSNLTAPLSSSESSNSTVALLVYVLDGLYAQSEARYNVSVQRKSKEEDALQIIAAATVTTETASKELAPEIVLPSLSKLLLTSVSSSNSSSCSVKLASDDDNWYATYGYASANDCLVRQVIAGARSLEVALNLSNNGIYLISGLSLYLQSVSNLGRNGSTTSATSSLLQTYNLLYESTLSVGFSVGDGSEAVTNMLESCDNLVTLVGQVESEELLSGFTSTLGLRVSPTSISRDRHRSTMWRSGRRSREGREKEEETNEESVMSAMDVSGNSSDSSWLSAWDGSANSSTLVLKYLTESINTLASTYLSSCPFGCSEKFRSSSFYSATILRDYWCNEEKSEDGEGVLSLLGEGVWVRKGSIFPMNETSSYGLAIVSSAVKKTAREVHFSGSSGGTNSSWNRSHTDGTNGEWLSSSLNRSEVVIHGSKYVDLSVQSPSMSEQDAEFVVQFALNMSNNDGSTNSSGGGWEMGWSGRSFYYDVGMNATVLYENCSNLVEYDQDVLIVCSTEQTGGPEYTFSVSSAVSMCDEQARKKSNASWAVAFVCPLYAWEAVCVMASNNISQSVPPMGEGGNYMFWSAESNSENASVVSSSGGFLCRYPISLNTSLSGVNGAGGGFGGLYASTRWSNGSYSYGVSRSQASPAKMSLFHSGSSSSSTSLSFFKDNSVLSYVAIAAITATGAAVALFLYYRLKKADLSFISQVDEDVASTSAEFMHSRTLSGAELDMKIEVDMDALISSAEEGLGGRQRHWSSKIWGDGYECDCDESDLSDEEEDECEEVNVDGNEENEEEVGGVEGFVGRVGRGGKGMHAGYMQVMVRPVPVATTAAGNGCVQDV
eukprot:gene5741-6325_t